METWVYNNASANDRGQDINPNQIELKVSDTYEKDEKLTTNFEPSDDSDFINKAYLDTKQSKLEGHISYIEKEYNEFKLLSNKQSVEEVPIRRTVKSTIQILYDKGLFDNYDNVDEVLKDFLFVESRRPDLEEVNDLIQWL